MTDSVSPSSVELLAAAGFNIDTLADYALAAGSFELFPKHFNNVPAIPAWQVRFTHASLGLSSENGELASALRCVVCDSFPVSNVDLVNLLEELGDRLWYLAVLWNIRAECMPGVMSWDALCSMYTMNAEGDDRSLVECLSAIIVHDGELANQSKRILFYQKPHDPALVSGSFVHAFQATQRICAIFGLPVVEVARRNILKLHNRKSAAAKKNETVGSLDRDLAAERKALGAV